MADKPWAVSYLPWNGRRSVVRRFATEPRARAFYRSLWRRRDPPAEQSIERDDGRDGRPGR